MGKLYLEDVLETMGAYVDSLKFAGGSFTVMPGPVVRGLIEPCHAHQVSVSTGGFVERVIAHGPAAVDQYIGTCKDLGFDTIEVSSGFISPPFDDWLRLVDKIQSAGLAADPDQLILDVYRSTYEVSATLAGWDRPALERADPTRSSLASSNPPR